MKYIIALIFIGIYLNVYSQSPNYLGKRPQPFIYNIEQPKNINEINERIIIFYLLFTLFVSVNILTHNSFNKILYLYHRKFIFNKETEEFIKKHKIILYFLSISGLIGISIIIEPLLNLELTSIFLKVIFIYLAIILLNYIITITSEYLFEHSKELFNQLNAISHLFFSNLGIISIITLFIISFLKTEFKNYIIMLWIIYALFLYILKIIRQLQTFNYKRFSIFGFILYFCAVEIIPIAIALTKIK